MILGRLDRLQRGGVNVSACRAAFARGEFPAYRIWNGFLMPHFAEDRLIVLPAGPDLLLFLATLSRALEAPELLWEPGWSQLGRPSTGDFRYVAENSLYRAFVLVLKELGENATAPPFTSLGASCALIPEGPAHSINPHKYAPTAFLQAKEVYEHVARCFCLRENGSIPPLDDKLPGNPWGECKGR
jgi:hypothetical protein